MKTPLCAAIAVSSLVSEMAKGKTLDEGLAITNAKVSRVFTTSS